MTQIKTISLGKGNDYLIDQLVDKVPLGTSFTDSIMMAVEAFVKATTNPIPDVLEDIEIWKERISKLPPQDLAAVHSRVIQLKNLCEWEMVEVSNR